MRKRLTGLISLIFLLAACGPADKPDVVDPVAIAPIADQEEPVKSTAVAADTDTTVNETADAISPAATVDEAAVIRSQDHVIGAEEPVVAIIEYGDYQ